MSPLTLKRIKEAKGNVRIIQSDSQSSALSVEAAEYSVQVLESNIWRTVFKGKNRQICEQVVQKAARQVILG